MNDEANRESAGTRDRIRFIRDQLSMSAIELGSVLGVHRREINLWIRGDSTPQGQVNQKLLLLDEVAQSWEAKSSEPLYRRLRQVCECSGVTLFGLLKDDPMNLRVIEEQLEELDQLPPHRSPSMKELAAKHGLSTTPHPDAEAVREIESGRPFASDFEES